MEKDTEDYVMQLEKRIVLLEGRVALLEAQLSSMRPIPTYPSYPQPNLAPPRRCAKCGMSIEGVMGYVCYDSYCPTFPKVTYNTTPNYGAWTGKLEPHLSNVDIEPQLPIYDVPLNIDGSTTSYSWDPIKQGDKKI